MEVLVSRGVCPCASVGGCVWPTPPLWGRWGPGADSGGTDTVSCLAEPSSEEPFLPHRLPPASSVLWAGRLSLPWQGQRGGPARGPWPRAARPQQAKDSLSWEGTGPGLQLLLLGGAVGGDGSHLSAQPSPPRGQRPRRGTTPKTLSVPSELIPPPVRLSQKPEKMSQVLGKWGSSWGPSPLDPNYCWLGVGWEVVCPLEDSLPVPPSHSGHGPVFQISPFPTLFPAASFTHPVLLKGALRRTNFLWTEQCPINLTRDLNLATFQPLI